ncbi:hypothetical protein CMV_000639 [Castanea mollissima]|uniref:Uncharacterized protein n=1 Tax=Castanea mollissima TaxID=60419 RepID=A0A8J4RYV9_9ROSI|nr:hypothetical protein CMV_000639 [Castanea mollissima]
MSSTAFKVLAMTIILALVLLVSCGAVIHDDATTNFKLGRRLLADYNMPMPTYQPVGGGGYVAPTHP